ncbi:MAG: hypothetical protein H6993_18000 [Pseudomonadales bacterium]|nr:hypothetical protein [Pseudomonadales bacterium]
MRHFLAGFAVLFLVGAAQAQNVTISVQNTEITQVIDMISRQERVNVLVPAKLTGEISLNLYDVPVEKALASVASAGGYALEKRGDTFFIINRDEVGQYADGDVTQLRWYQLSYADGEKVSEMVEKYLSRYGKVSYIADRKILVVEDSPDFLARVDRLLAAVDARPRQVMIEAKILEVTLNDAENLGIDWSDLFQSRGGNGSYGQQGFSAGVDAPGFFFDVVTPNVSVTLNALRDEGRLRTLSTPKLVALENQEASVVIGDRRGYQVTTTINQVTTESIEFLESGVILRVMVQIDDDNHVLMSVHPEVSTGAVDANGIPSQNTTEVTTNILVPSGETVFIGGLIKKSETERRRSVPVLNRIPGVRRLFSGTENTQITTETVVLITPVIAEDGSRQWNQDEVRRVRDAGIPKPNYKAWPKLTRWPAGRGDTVGERAPAAVPAAGKLRDDSRPNAHAAPKAVATKAAAQPPRSGEAGAGGDASVVTSVGVTGDVNAAPAQQSQVQQAPAQRSPAQRSPAQQSPARQSARVVVGQEPLVAAAPTVVPDPAPVREAAIVPVQEPAIVPVQEPALQEPARLEAANQESPGRTAIPESALSEPTVAAEASAAGNGGLPETEVAQAAAPGVRWLN